MFCSAVAVRTNRPPAAGLTLVFAAISVLAALALGVRAASAEPVTIELLEFGKPLVDWYKTEADAFMKVHPDIRVKIVQTAGVNAQDDLVTTRLAAGDPPDIISDMLRTYSVYADHLVDLQPLLDGSGSIKPTDFLPGLLQVAKYRGHLYSLPLLGAGPKLTFFIGRDFTDAGLETPYQMDLAKRWSRASGVAAAQKLVKLGADGNPTHWGWDPARGGLDWGWTSIIYAGGGRVLTDDNRKVAFDQPAAIEALDWLAKVYNQYRVGSLDVTFRTGRVAMGTAVLNMAQVAWNQQHIDSIGVAPVPPAENGAPSANVLFAEGVSIFNNDPARVQAAWKFIEWCATHQAQVDYVDKTGRIPARRDALARWADAAAPFSGGAAGVEVFSQAIQDGVAPPYGAHYTAMSKLLDPVIDNILSGKVAAAVALKSAAPAVQALLDATYGAP